MERTYVFNVIFKIMAAAGIISLIGLAGMSDFGDISNARIFLQGGISFAAAAIGVWGYVNCSRAIEAEKRRARRAKRRSAASVGSAA